MQRAGECSVAVHVEEDRVQHVRGMLASEVGRAPRWTGVHRGGVLLWQWAEDRQNPFGVESYKNVDFLRVQESEARCVFRGPREDKL